MEPDVMFARFKAICLAHPDTCLTMTWGSPHFRIGGEKGKIFVGGGIQPDGNLSIGVRVELDLQAALVASDPRFTIAAYVGKYGGVDFAPGPNPNWGEVEALVATSYKIIAGKRKGAGGKRIAPPLASKRAGSTVKTAKKPVKAKTTEKPVKAKKAAATRKPAARPAAKRKPAAARRKRR